MKEITIGSSYTTQWTVTEDMLACNIGSGEARVFSTPMLAALVENAAMNCVKAFLDDGETTVGTFISIEHKSASPIGIKVSACAKVAAVTGREITFEVSAADECGEIGTALHKRFVLGAEKFQAKADSKLAKR